MIDRLKTELVDPIVAALNNLADALRAGPSAPTRLYETRRERKKAAAAAPQPAEPEPEAPAPPAEPADLEALRSDLRGRIASAYTSDTQKKLMGDNPESFRFKIKGAITAVHPESNGLLTRVPDEKLPEIEAALKPILAEL